MINDNDVNVHIGAAVRARRTKKKLTQAEFAELSDGDFTQTSIAMYERGERAIVPSRLIRLAEILGCSPCSLLPKPSRDAEIAKVDDALDTLGVK